jgi:hypothetical protein
VIWIFTLTPPALVIAGAVIWANLLKPPHGRHAFPDPADTADPDGEQYIADLKRDPDADWWAHHAPLPPRVTVVTGPLAILGRDGMTPAQLADRLAARHMPEMIP